MFFGSSKSVFPEKIITPNAGRLQAGRLQAGLFVGLFLPAARLGKTCAAGPGVTGVEGSGHLAFWQLQFM